MNLGLLIIDMQQAFGDQEQTKTSVNQALEYINETSDLFRSNHLPVIVIQDNEVDEGPGSPGFENVEGLVIHDSDVRLFKDYNNAFWKTNLDEQLKALNVDFLIISGFAAEYCVLFTLNGARERGYGASLLQHGIAGVDPEQVKQIQLLRPVISLEAIDYIINKAKKYTH